jgi:hypothetical protein
MADFDRLFGRFDGEDSGEPAAGGTRMPPAPELILSSRDIHRR